MVLYEACVEMWSVELSERLIDGLLLAAWKFY